MGLLKLWTDELIHILTSWSINHILVIEIQIVIQKSNTKNPTV